MRNMPHNLSEGGDSAGAVIEANANKTTHWVTLTVKINVMGSVIKNY